MQETNQPELFKGEYMEEQLRTYFNGLGYYIVRGIKYKYQDFDVTDIDLWLYNRPTYASREIINVDIKNKKTPAAIERIFWVKGIKEILGFDRCIVATTDRRDAVREFGQKHGVTVLDGSFLQRVRTLNSNRHSEEGFNNLLKTDYSKFTTNWVMVYENSKSRLIDGLNFSNCNSILNDIKLILEQIIVSPLQRTNLLKLLYAILGHFLINVDYILKDMAFIDTPIKLKSLEDGFRYGEVNTMKIQESLSQLSKQTGVPVGRIKKASEILPVDILRDFFGKNDNSRNLFKWAKDFESVSYDLNFISPSSLDLELKGVLGMVCDFSVIERKKIFGA